MKLIRRSLYDIGLISMFHNFLPEKDFVADFGECLKKRSIDQKFLYAWEGAYNYYHAYGTFGDTSETSLDDYGHVGLDLVSFLRPHIAGLSSFVLVSLGCGNGYAEKGLLHTLLREGCEFSYVGIDSSQEMLQLVEDNLSADSFSGLDKHFVRADICDDSLPVYIDSVVSSDLPRIYVFMGSTLGNFDQAYIFHVLRGLLRPSDFLAFDVLTRPNNDASVMMKLFDRYSGYLSDTRMVRCELGPLMSRGLDPQSFKLSLEHYTDDAFGAYCYKFSAEFLCDASVSTDSGCVLYGLGEKISCSVIRNYDVSTFVTAVEGFGLLCVGHESNELYPWLHETQFLYKRT